MRYRPKTRDYIDTTGKVWDLYDVVPSWQVSRSKEIAQSKYKYVRVIKRKEGLLILVR